MLLIEMQRNVRHVLVSSPDDFLIKNLAAKLAGLYSVIHSDRDRVTNIRHRELFSFEF